MHMLVTHVLQKNTHIYTTLTCFVQGKRVGSHPPSSSELRDLIGFDPVKYGVFVDNIPLSGETGLFSSRHCCGDS